MNVLLNDSSVLLNLLAAGCLEIVARATGWQLAICPAVRNEVKRLRDQHTGELVDVDLSPFITAGLLRVLELSGEVEEALYVEQAAVVDDGEAMSIALAASRRLDLAIDDRQARNHAHRIFPEIRLWSTPDILKKWVDAAQIEPSVLREAIRLVEIRARYFPPKTHPLAGWWQASRQV